MNPSRSFSLKNKTVSLCLPTVLICLCFLPFYLKYKRTPAGKARIFGPATTSYGPGLKKMEKLKFFSSWVPILPSAVSQKFCPVFWQSDFLIIVASTPPFPEVVDIC
ncbi:MAG: hypothetical protein JRJ54_10755 [Deltaproteobacteria bacterium]|nr:hypothetical protein [Deltaproteobacteria bacterium]